MIDAFMDCLQSPRMVTGAVLCCVFILVGILTIVEIRS